MHILYIINKNIILLCFQSLQANLIVNFIIYKHNELNCLYSPVCSVFIIVSVSLLRD